MKRLAKLQRNKAKFLNVKTKHKRNKRNINEIMEDNYEFLEFCSG